MNKPHRPLLTAAAIAVACLAWATPPAGAATLLFDDFESAPNPVNNGAPTPATGWYTPTGSFGEAEATSVNSVNNGGNRELQLGFGYDEVSVRRFLTDTWSTSRVYILEFDYRYATAFVDGNNDGFNALARGVTGAGADSGLIESQTFTLASVGQTGSARMSFTGAEITAGSAAGDQIGVWFYKNGANTPNRRDVYTIDNVTLRDAPANVSGDQTQSNTVIHVFEEEVASVNNLAVDRVNVAGQTYGPSAGSQSPTVSGKFLSYFVHFDPIAASTTATLTHTFDQAISAIIWEPGKLNATDSIFGIAEVLYPSEIGAAVTQFRGAINEATDQIIISADGRTVDLTLFAGTGGSVDQLRFLFAVPAPAALPAGLAMLGLIAARRRR